MRIFRKRMKSEVGLTEKVRIEEFSTGQTFLPSETYQFQRFQRGLVESFYFVIIINQIIFFFIIKLDKLNNS
jgi:hypothetical protein